MFIFLRKFSERLKFTGEATHVPCHYAIGVVLTVLFQFRFSFVSVVQPALQEISENCYVTNKDEYIT